MSKASTASTPALLAARARELLDAHQRSIWVRTDRLFAALLACEWLAGVLLAAIRSPWAYDGLTRSIHPHLLAAVVLGGVLISLPIFLVFTRPGSTATRNSIAASQMLMTGLMIHLGDGRIEMHFIIFGSFAFLAFYRDWRVLLTGVVVVAGDHLLRGYYSPLSVYGIATPSGWRTFEHAAWVIFENIFLVASCVQGVREMEGIAQGRAQLEASHYEVEQKVFERTRELKTTQDELLKAARTAGMAEIATSVLHNVGNVLNSVNVSATVVADRIRKSDIPTLGQVSGLLIEHRDDLGTYISSDERGKLIPDFIAQLAGCLTDDQESLITEIEVLTKGIDHIKQIVAAQQSMAKKSNVRTTIEPSRLFESALTMQAAAMPKDIEIYRNFVDAGEIELDEHKILQILVNLISNARQAIVARNGPSRRLTVGIALAAGESGSKRIQFSVTDAGVGIAPENLSRIFAHGFTTKAEGHGFGLHSAANAAREMGGDLSVASAGIGHGATFTLDLPVVATSTAQEQTS